jgi:hypothetical protein
LYWLMDGALLLALLLKASGNYSKATESFHGTTGLRETTTRHQSAYKNLRHPVNSYKY